MSLPSVLFFTVLLPEKIGSALTASGVAKFLPA